MTTKLYQTLFFVLTALLLAACSEPAEESEPVAANNVEPAAETVATETAVLPTDTPAPTSTPTPTNTPVPTNTPEPTNTPAPTSTPEPTPDPFPGYAIFESDTAPLTLRYPEEWTAEEANGTIVITNDVSTLLNGFQAGLMILAIPEDGLSIKPDAYLEILGQSFMQSDTFDDMEAVGEVETAEYNGLPAANVEYTAAIPEDGSPIRVLITAVKGGTTTVSFLMFVTEEMAEEARPVYNDVTSSIQMDVAIVEIDKSMFVVDTYDPERDPAADVAEALELANENDKKVLLIVGGDWCITCHLLDGFIESTPAIAEGLKDAFVIVKVNMSEENENETFLSNYPDIEWYPHMYILDQDGSLAHSYDTRELETDGVYDEAKFATFLDEWRTGEPSGEANSTDSYYLVDEYDPERDPFADVETAVAKAQAENKRILLIAGGDWCIWCHIMEEFMHDTQSVADLLTDNYIIVKVNVSEENENTKFFTQYPEIPGYPHILVLHTDGTFLHNQRTIELETDDTYDETKFVEFLETWILEG